MGKPSSPPTEVISPEEAFELLGHDTRIAIVQALWERGNEPTTFSELREHAEVADSGQFNYHLGRLVDTFVRRDEGGYKLTFAGRRIVGAILDGTYTKQASIEPFDIGITCGTCDTPLKASYEDEAFRIRCSACDDVISRFDFPPGTIDGRTRDELVEAAGYWIRSQFLLIVNGICSNCTGTMTHSFCTDSKHRDQEVWLEYDCERCMEHASSTIGWALANHPAVISFFYDNDSNSLSGNWYIQPWLINSSTTVLSENPWRIQVRFPLGNDEFELKIDENLEVIEESHP